MTLLIERFQEWDSGWGGRGIFFSEKTVVFFFVWMEVLWFFYNTTEAMEIVKYCFNLGIVWTIQHLLHEKLCLLEGYANIQTFWGESRRTLIQWHESYNYSQKEWFDVEEEDKLWQTF